MRGLIFTAIAAIILGLPASRASNRQDIYRQMLQKRKGYFQAEISRRKALSWRPAIPILALPELGDLDIRHQVIQVTPQLSSRTMDGLFAVTFANASSNPLKERLTFFLMGAPVISVSDSQGRRLDHDTTSEGWLLVDLKSALAPGEETTITMVVSGRVTCYDWSGNYSMCDLNSRLSHIIDVVWYPLNGEALTADRFTYELTVTVPERYTVAATGMHRGTETHGVSKSYKYGTTIPTPYVGFAIAQYQSATGQASPDAGNIPVKIFYLQETRSTSEFIHGELIGAVGFYSKNYSQFPFAKLDLAQISSLFPGGYGPQSTTFVSQDFFTGPPQRDHWLTKVGIQVVTHEAAHQWFGNHVDIYPDKEAFLSESLAEYSSAANSQRIWGNREHFLTNILNYQYEMKGLSDPPIISDAAVNSPNYFNIVYEKGSFVLDMLRRLVGSNNFHGSVQAYVQANAGSFADSEDFKTAFMNADPSGSIDWFFAQWLHRGGYPAIEAEVHRETLGNGQHQVRIQLSQPGYQKWRLPLDILIHTEGGQALSHQVDWDGSYRVLSYATTHPPVSVSLDPNRYLIRQLSAPLTGDVNLSGTVDGMDLIDLVFRKEQGREQPEWEELFDLDNSEKIDDSDRNALLNQFGQGD